MERGCATGNGKEMVAVGVRVWMQVEAKLEVRVSFTYSSGGIRGQGHWADLPNRCRLPRIMMVCSGFRLVSHATTPRRKEQPSKPEPEADEAGIADDGRSGVQELALWARSIDEMLENRAEYGWLC